MIDKWIRELGGVLHLEIIFCSCQISINGVLEDVECTDSVVLPPSEICVGLCCEMAKCLITAAKSNVPEMKKWGRNRLKDLNLVKHQHPVSKLQSVVKYTLFFYKNKVYKNASYLVY